MRASFSTSPTPTLDVCSQANRWIPHEPLHIGSIRLTDIKKALIALGIKADVVRGVVVVDDGELVVKKEGNGCVIEGGLCKEYFRVRSCLYSLVAIL